MTSEQQNPLAVDKISSLILRFSVPSIIAMLVSAVYNIADQLFIGNAVGTLGNAATNIAFPLAMMCTGLGLLFGIGGAASFNHYLNETRLRKRIKQNLCRKIAKLRKRKKPLSEDEFKQTLAAWWGWAKYSDSEYLINKLNKITPYEIKFRR